MWTSGPAAGCGGAERGYCLMIGGDETVVRRLDPVFTALAPSVEAAPRTPGRKKLGGTEDAPARVSLPSCLPLHYAPASGHQVEDEHHQGHNQQQVDQTAAYVQTEPK